MPAIWSWLKHIPHPIYIGRGSYPLWPHISQPYHCSLQELIHNCWTLLHGMLNQLRVWYMQSTSIKIYLTDRPMVHQFYRHRHQHLTRYRYSTSFVYRIFIMHPMVSDLSWSSRGVCACVRLVSCTKANYAPTIVFSWQFRNLQQPDLHSATATYSRFLYRNSIWEQRGSQTRASDRPGNPNVTPHPMSTPNKYIS